MNERIKNAKKWRGDDCGYTEFEYRREEKKSTGFDFKGLLKKYIVPIVMTATAIFGMIIKGKKAFA
jgi:hypothetical protein